MKYQFPLAYDTLDGQDRQAAADVLEKGQLTMGPLCAEFERQFAAYHGRRYGVFVNSGSSANLLATFALRAPGVATPMQPDHHVIVPAMTWSTSIWPIHQVGGITRFVDSHHDTLQADTQDIYRVVNEKTYAMIIPHIMGNAVDVGSLSRFCQEKGIWLIEDCCESLGATLRGKRVGTYSDMATYSFYFSHHMTTIEGGMILCDDEALYDTLTALRSHGWTRQMKNPVTAPGIDSRYLFVMPGFNVRPTELNAALGLSQLLKLDHMNRRRQDIALELCYALENHHELRPMRVDHKVECSWFGFPIMCSDTALRDRLKIYLEDHSVETRPIVAGNMARHPGVQHIEYISDDLAGADKIMDYGLYIGISPMMDDEIVSGLAKILRDF